MNSGIYNMDCLEAMRELPADFFQLAIVDPPYGIGDNWSKSRTDRFYKKGALHKYKNDKIPPEEYFQLLKKVSVNQIIWGGNYFTEYLPPTNAWIVWNKKHNTDTTFMSHGELAHTSFKRPLIIYDHQWSGARKGSENGKCNKIHPHQKPIKLYEWCLINYAKKGDKILDTHMGSGSSAIAADRLGFELWGYELDKDYYKAAVKRINQEKQVLRMFK